MTLKALGLGLLTAFAAAGPAAAHHSFAMFDDQHPMTFTATVKELEWVNPHSWLRVMVMDEKTGKPVQWALELGSPAQQERIGWQKDSVKAGDKVTVTIHPLKDGARGGGLISATLPSGQTLGNGGLQRGGGPQSSKFPGGLPAGIHGAGE